MEDTVEVKSLHAGTEGLSESRSGSTERDGPRFHHATQSNAQFKTYVLFISGIFHSIFLDCGRMQVTKITEQETMEKGELLLSTLPR